MKHIIYTILIISIPGLTWSQGQYKITKTSGTLNLMGIDELEILGYDGSEIIFENNDYDEGKNERSKGLKIITSSGLDDNSGIGLSINESGDVISVQQISNGASCNCNDGYTIKVPQSLNLNIQHSTTYGDDVKISNLKGEIEISVNYNDVFLKNVTGPLAIKTVYGDLDVSFTNLNQNSPSSLVSVYGHVDVSLPSSSQADLQVSTQYGALYSDMNVKIKKNTGIKELKPKYNSKKVNGTLNEGGVEIYLSSMYDDVYLRSSNL